MTKQRKLIYDIVSNSCSHPTVEQIYFSAKEVMPSIVMATVYNNINALTEMGVIRRVSVHGEPDRYDNIKVPHEHVKCDCCGIINDVFLDDVFTKLKSLTGLNLTSYELNLHYICDNCCNNDK